MGRSDAQGIRAIWRAGEGASRTAAGVPFPISQEIMRLCFRDWPESDGAPKPAVIGNGSSFLPAPLEKQGKEKAEGQDTDGDSQKDPGGRWDASFWALARHASGRREVSCIFHLRRRLHHRELGIGRAVVFCLRGIRGAAILCLLGVCGTAVFWLRCVRRSGSPVWEGRGCPHICPAAHPISHRAHIRNYNISSINKGILALGF